MILLAKSARNGGTSLRDHTAQVILAARHIASAYFPPHQNSLAQRGALLHDLGKAHPYFQERLREDGDSRRDPFEVPHRHEISSLLFLPLFDEAEWHELIEMVVAHHKSAGSEPNQTPGRGLLDLSEGYSPRAVFDRHAEKWADWHPLVFPILEEFGINPRLISLEEARAAFDFALEHCEAQSTQLGRSEWRGLLMSADHLASALEDQTETRVERLFQRPDLAPFIDRSQTASVSLYPLAKKPINHSGKHTLVIAPTGSGKTDFLMRGCRTGRVFYLLPFQASINAIYLRLDTILNQNSSDKGKTDIRRVHAASQIEIYTGGKDNKEPLEEEFLLQKHPGAAIKVMTPHQIASIIFGTAGHEATALDVRGQDVILDEVHVYGEQTQAMVLNLITALTRLDARIHIGSATIPTALREEIVRRLGGSDAVHFVRLTDTELETYNRHTIHRIADETGGREQVTAALQDGKRILFLSNRVADAQERFLWVKNSFPDIPALLLHSRFRRRDRAAQERRIEEFDKGQGPCIVCATQVVEVSLDISFDTLVTDAAPFDALVQRFGRVNRRRTETPKLCPVYVIAPPDNKNKAKPYSLDVLRRSFDNLPDDGQPLMEVTLQDRIDKVYPSVDIHAIDVHLSINAEGDAISRLLWNRPRSLLLEALEIESVACILSSDVEAYRTYPQGRTELEIPLSWNTLRPHLSANEWIQLKDVGHNPFVIPETLYTETLGLYLKSDGQRN